MQEAYSGGQSLAEVWTLCKEPLIKLIPSAVDLSTGLSVESGIPAGRRECRGEWCEGGPLEVEAEWSLESESEEEWTWGMVRKLKICLQQGCLGNSRVR